MVRTRTSILGIVVMLVLVMLISGCGGKMVDADKVKLDDKNETTGGATEETQSANEATEDKEGNKNPIVTIEMATGAKMNIELYPDVAPNTVTNFVNLVSSGFYDGLIFHRVIPGFMIQGGDPDGIGTGGPGYGIKGEFSSNGFDNKLIHEKGVISMARSQHPDSAGSQFFLMTAPAPHLDGGYAGFGKVIEGLEVLEVIGNVQTGAQDRPIEDQVIKTMTVETFGVEYGSPVKSPQN